jgi:hypothetical protein
MTLGQDVVVAGLDFTMLRILLLAGWLRVMIRGEAHLGALNAVDMALVGFAVSGAIAYSILWGTLGGVINRCGMLYDVLGGYFLFRMLLKDDRDCINALNFVTWCVGPLAVCMLVEKTTGRNPFSIFGGVPLSPEVRNGVLRCEGPFGHPILAGTFGATLVPLFVGLRRQPGVSKALGALAIVSCLVVVYAAGSSGPILALAAGLLALALWPLRRYMRLIRWAAALSIVGLQLVMKTPIWFLLDRVDLFSGSTGFYRAYLIDRAVANFSEWWLIGIRSTEGWADASLHLHDRTNQYIVIGTDGGLLSLVMFVAMIALAFRSVGLGVERAEGDPKRQRLLWAFGATLFAHCVNYISISYFDQNVLMWYLLLAMISAVSVSAGVVPALSNAVSDVPTARTAPRLSPDNARVPFGHSTASPPGRARSRAQSCSLPNSRFNAGRLS